MRKAPLALLPLLLAAAAAAQVPSPAERVTRTLGQELPAVPPLGPTAQQGPLFTQALWDALPAPDAATLKWLAGRVPGLDASLVREAGPDILPAVLAQAVARGLSATDLFSDEGLRAPRMILARGAVLSGAFGAYDIPVITLAGGKTTDGRDYAMQALLMGAGRVEMLYSLDGFRVANPYFPDHEYTLAGRVSHGIQGPGDLTVSGITVEMFMHPRITRFVKVGPGTLRVETNLGSRERPVRPITRKP